MDRRPQQLSMLPSSPSFTQSGAPSTPIRFPATTGAFGLSSHYPHHQNSNASVNSNTSGSTASSSGSGALAGTGIPQGSPTAVSPTATVPLRLRRSSLLSLASPMDSTIDRPGPSASTSPTALRHPLSFGQNASGGPSHIGSPPALQPLPRWATGVSPFTAITGSPVERVSSAPPIPIEGLTTGASPPTGPTGRSADRSMMEMDDLRSRSPPRWLPSHLQSGRKGSKELLSALGEDSGIVRSRTAFPGTGRPLHGALLATLISESAPLEHEMRSEARLQRLLSSHPSALPLTPRQRRNTRFSRGRFPEMVGDDDDDDDEPTSLGARWLRATSSDSDSDMMDDFSSDWASSSAAAGAGAVNSAFASVMDLDARPSSSGGSSGAMARSESGKSTPTSRTGVGATGNGSGAGSVGFNVPTPPGQWIPIKGGPGSARGPPTPGSGLQLPTAFGDLAMGSATPLGSPTAERMPDFGTSPSASMALASPSIMQYRDPAAARNGKRKAAAEERYDPYKRPRAGSRAGSPSPFQNAAFSPTKSTLPTPSSPSHVPLVTSSLALSSPGFLSLTRQVKPVHTVKGHKAAGAAKGPHPHTHTLPHGHAHSHSHSVSYARPLGSASRSRAASPALSIGSTSGVLSTSIGAGAGRALSGPFIPTGPGASAAVSAAAQMGAAPQALGGLGFLSLGMQEGPGGEGGYDGDGNGDGMRTPDVAMEED